MFISSYSFARASRGCFLRPALEREPPALDRPEEPPRLRPSLPEQRPGPERRRRRKQLAGGFLPGFGFGFAPDDLQRPAASSRDPRLHARATQRTPRQLPRLRGVAALVLAREKDAVRRGGRLEANHARLRRRRAVEGAGEPPPLRRRDRAAKETRRGLATRAAARGRGRSVRSVRIRVRGVVVVRRARARREAGVRRGAIRAEEDPSARTPPPLPPPKPAPLAAASFGAATRRPGTTRAARAGPRSAGMENASRGPGAPPAAPSSDATDASSRPSSSRSRARAGLGSDDPDAPSRARRGATKVSRRRHSSPAQNPSGSPPGGSPAGTFAPPSCSGRSNAVSGNASTVMKPNPSPGDETGAARGRAARGPVERGRRPFDVVEDVTGEDADRAAVDGARAHLRASKRRHRPVEQNARRAGARVVPSAAVRRADDDSERPHGAHVRDDDPRLDVPRVEDDGPGVRRVDAPRERSRRRAPRAPRAPGAPRGAPRGAPLGVGIGTPLFVRTALLAVVPARLRLLPVTSSVQSFHPPPGRRLGRDLHGEEGLVGSAADQTRGGARAG